MLLVLASTGILSCNRPDPRLPPLQRVVSGLPHKTRSTGRCLGLWMADSELFTQHHAAFNESRRNWRWGSLVRNSAPKLDMNRRNRRSALRVVHFRQLRLRTVAEGLDPIGRL